MGYMCGKNGKMVVNCEQKKVWYNVLTEYFILLSYHLPEETEKNHENLSGQTIIQERSKPSTSKIKS